MKKWLIILANVTIALLILCNYKQTQVVTKPSDVTYPESDKVDYYDINVTYEENLGDIPLKEVEEAIRIMPAPVIKGFCQDKWKIAIVSEVDLTGTPYEKEKDVDYITVGLTDYNAKTIQIRPVSNSPEMTKIKALHEMCHYADVYYGNASDTAEFGDLYKKYKDKYVEYEFCDLKETDKTRRDIQYATSDRYEFFASSMKDYLLNPQYLRSKYPDLLNYYLRLEGENNL